MRTIHPTMWYLKFPPLSENKWAAIPILEKTSIWGAGASPAPHRNAKRWTLRPLVHLPVGRPAGAHGIASKEVDHDPPDFDIIQPKQAEKGGTAKNSASQASCSLHSAKMSRDIFSKSMVNPKIFPGGYLPLITLFFLLIYFISDEIYHKAVQITDLTLMKKRKKIGKPPRLRRQK